MLQNMAGADSSTPWEWSANGFEDGARSGP